MADNLRLDPDLTAQVKAQLANNPRFRTWQQGVGNAMAAPQKFGVDLPHGAWIDKLGNVHTVTTGFPWKPFLGTVGVGATLGFGAPFIAGVGGASAAGGGAAAAGGVPSLPWTLPAGISGMTAPTAVGGGAVATHLGLTASEIAKLGAGGADTILGLLGNRGQTRAAREAAQLQAQGLAAQLQFERENEARRREEYDRTEAQAKAQWDAEQARRAPYRAAAAAILSRYTGQPASNYTAPVPYSGAPVSKPLAGPTTIGAMAGMPSASAVPTVAPLTAPQAVYNPNARTIGDLIAPRY